MINKLNPECGKALSKSLNAASECSIHIGVFPKVESSFLMKQIDFSIKVM